MSALAETRGRLDQHVQWYITHRSSLDHVSADTLAQYSEIVRDIDEFFGTVQPQSGTLDPETRAMVAWAALLRESSARILAVAGPDASWGLPDGQPERIVLSARDSQRLTEALDASSPPNDVLRFAAKRYRAMIGL